VGIHVNHTGLHSGHKPALTWGRPPAADDLQGRDWPRKAAEVAEFDALLHPVDRATFSGALDSKRLGLAERVIVRRVHAADGDFRDWDAIDRWAPGDRPGTRHRGWRRRPVSQAIRIRPLIYFS
jgi:hypothetical protein